jgi:S1-C subfamily serine protease
MQWLKYCATGILVGAMISGGAVALADNTPPVNLRDTFIVDVVKKTKAAVVRISVTKMAVLIGRGARGRGGAAPGQNGPRVKETGVGSGFIIHRDGYVVTNNHVIEDAMTIEVVTQDGKSHSAEVINADPSNDLAILKMSDLQPFPFIELADSDALTIGEPAIAIGNPFGLSFSVSSGIISAVKTEIPHPADEKPDQSMQDVLQTDAAINPGNSGGPLLNAYGQVVGINTAVFYINPNSGEPSAQNIGFAIPVNRLRDLLPDLMNPEKSKNLQYPVKFAERRMPNGPDKVDAVVYPVDQPESVLVTIDGKPVHDIVDAYDLILAAHDGQALKLGFSDGQTRSVVGKPLPADPTVVLARDRLGLLVKPMTPLMAGQLFTQQDDGLFVEGIVPGGPADRGGKFSKGDILTGMTISVDRQPTRIKNLDDFAKYMSSIALDAKLRVRVARGDMTSIIILNLGAAATQPSTIQPSTTQPSITQTSITPAAQQ